MERIALAQARFSGIKEAYEKIVAEIGALMVEHTSIRLSIIGGPTRRHNEIISDIRVLRRVAGMLADMAQDCPSGEPMGDG